MTHVRAMAMATVGLVLLAGCSSPDPEPPVATAAPTASEAPTSAPTPTTTSAGPRDLSDPALGIVFTDFPRDQEEPVAAAIETYMMFET